MMVTRGETATLQCMITMYNGDVSWSHDGQPLSHGTSKLTRDPRYSVETGISNGRLMYMLKIMDVNYGDGGMYNCTSGRHSESVFMYVTGMIVTVYLCFNAICSFRQYYKVYFYL